MTVMAAPRDPDAPGVSRNLLYVYVTTVRRESL